jgi:hypothetical protein
MDEREKLIKHIEAKSDKIDDVEQIKNLKIIIRAKSKNLNIDILSEQYFRVNGKSADSIRGLFNWIERMLDYMTESSDAA